MSAEAIKLPDFTRSELRASHAGETGAVWIYRGILLIEFFSRDTPLRQFARHHLQTEKRHLAGFEHIIHHFRGSILLPVWCIAGLLTGAIPALLGRNWVYYTIFCVETFVDEHYAHQFKVIERDTHPITEKFRNEMHNFHADEQQHRAEALNAMTCAPTRPMQIWGKLIKSGSGVAVSLARVM